MPLATSSGTLPNVDVPVCVAYQVSTNADLSGRLVSQGEAFTSYDVDWTVKVEATGLRADTKYFYRFKDCATKATSPIGTTRTIASADSKPDFACQDLFSLKETITSQLTAPAHSVNGGKPLVMAVFSCSQYQAGKFSTNSLVTQFNVVISFKPGWFNAYGFAAHNTTADIFIHLGDYVWHNSHY